MKLSFNLSNDIIKEITFNENIDSLLLYEYDKLNCVCNKIDLKTKDNNKFIIWDILLIEDKNLVCKKYSRKLNDVEHFNHIYKYLKFNRDFELVKNINCF